MASDSQTRDGVPGAQTTADEALSGIARRLRKALGFAILAILINVVAAIAMVGATIGMATQDRFTGVTLFFGYVWDLIPFAPFLAGAVLGVVIVSRVWRMLNAANAEDVAALKALSSHGRAVIAKIVGYVLPGVFLSRADGSIRALPV